MKLGFITLLAAFVTCGCASNDAGHPRDPRQGSVTPQDYFFYSCIHAYMKANSIPLFDGSPAYGIEHSEMSGAALARLQSAAQEYAKTIRAPDYADTEHGSPAVLVACQQAARRNSVSELAREKPGD